MFQFRYRYHYYDNEVSPWSPISDVVPSNHDLSNSTGVVPDPFVQNRIEVSVRNSSGIVKYIELCGRRCKDLGVMSRGTRGEFFTIAKINNNFAAWQINNESTQIIDFRNDQLYPIIDAGEGDRLFDAVPRSAHTQTILGNNRLAYANYTVGYDVPLINVQLNPQYGFSQSDPSQEYGELITIVQHTVMALGFLLTLMDLEYHHLKVELITILVWYTMMKEVGALLF